MKMVKILLDCFGGDHSPEDNVDGGLQALKAMPDLELILTGDEEALKKRSPAKNTTRRGFPSSMRRKSSIRARSLPMPSASKRKAP